MTITFFIDHFEFFVLATEFHMFVTFFIACSALDLATAISACFVGTTGFEQSLDYVVHFFSFGGMEILQELWDFGIFRMISARRRD